MGEKLGNITYTKCRYCNFRYKGNSLKILEAIKGHEAKHDITETFIPDNSQKKEKKGKKKKKEKTQTTKNEEQKSSHLEIEQKRKELEQQLKELENLEQTKE